MAGIPVSVTRSYSSLNANSSGDFGYGWSMAYADVTVQTSQLGAGTQAGFGSNNGFEIGTRVWVTLPGGKREMFTFEPQAQGGDNEFQWLFTQYYTPAFQAGPGVTDTLTVDTDDIDLQTPDGSAAGQGSQLVDAGSFDAYNPADPEFGGHYILTTAQGLKYDINAQTGKLTSIADRNGNTLTLGTDDLRATAADGTTIGQVTFTRDQAGRITAITQPDGKQLLYTYDAAGNLATFTDAGGKQTRYEYTVAGRPHFLSAIIDASGTTVVQAQFDPTTGRLSGLTNAFGQTVPLSYDLSAGPGQYAETTADALGFTTSTIADANGNVTRTVKQINDPSDPADATYQVVVSQYDADNNLTAQSEPFDTDFADRFTAQPTARAQQSTYDGLGDQLTSTDALGNVTRSSYNGYGQLTSQTDPMGNTTTYKYDGSGNLASSTDALGNTTTYKYDAKGDLIATYDANGTLISSSSYDGAGHMVSATDASGRTTTYKYDADGNLKSTSYVWTDPSDPAITQMVATGTTYDNAGHVTDSTDAYGRTTHTDYNANGQVLDTIDPQGVETLYFYDATGNTVETETEDDGTVTSVTDTVYDADNRAVWTDEAHLPGQTVEGMHTIYDGLGQVVETDEVAAVVITVTTGADGISSSVVTSSGAVQSSSTTVYNADGTVASQTDANGLTTTFTYDADGQQLTATQHNVPVRDVASGQTVAQNLTTTYTYDADGNQSSETDPLGHVTSYQYDGDGQPTVTTYADGTTTTDGYDNLGNKVSQTDQLGRTTTYKYDASGNLVEVDALAVADGAHSGTVTVPVTTYTYDAYGHELTQTDADHHMTSWTYDAYGRELTRTLPDGESESYTYDGYGRVSTYTDFDGNVATYTYFAVGGLHAGQLEQVVYTGTAGSGKATQTLSYTYDGQGRQSTVADASGTTTDSYDGYSNLVEEQTPEGTVWHVYDPATGLESEAYTDYTDTHYGYDSLGRLTTVTVKTRSTPTGAWSAGAVTTYAYDADGNKASEMLPNGDVTTYSYDALNRLTEQKTTNVSGTAVFDETFTLDADGNRLSAHEVQVQADGSTVTSDATWKYDADGRLASEALTASGNANAADENYSDAYTYDLAGNRTTDTHIGPGDGASGTTTYTYNGDDELTQSASTASGTTTYTYDANGSQLTSTNGSRVTTYTFDVRNKMVTATVNGQTATYAYDDAGDRVQETTGGVTTYYLTDNANPTGYVQPVEQRASPTSAPTVTYLIGDHVYGQVTSAGTSYFLTDGHGSTVALTGSTGTVTATYAYTAYGDGLNFTLGTAGTIYLYGEDAIYDGASGLYLHGDGTRGRSGFRFVEADTEGSGNGGDPSTLHRYLYVNADPIDLFDPTGHSAVSTVLLGTRVHSFLNRAFEGYTLAIPGFPASVGLNPPRRLPAGPGSSGLVRRWSNRQVRTIARYLGYPGSINYSRPDFVEYTRGTTVGSIYELKPLNPAGVIAAAADLAFYSWGLSAAAPGITWGLGRTWMPSITEWPTFKSALMPPGDILVTYSNYAVAPGAIFYDVVGVSDVAELAAAASAAAILGSLDFVTAAAETTEEIEEVATVAEAGAADVAIADEADEESGVIGSIGFGALGLAA